MLNLISQIKRRTMDMTLGHDDLNLRGNRKSSLIEFGIDETSESRPSDFEICKGLVISLD